ncbi:PREDICTED: E3 ubiquitin-protein ligase listerin [Cyphomyrmex costatus]|uniref:E3 ubiquitin-protein ligase listerin n=1 Tax=Cyphomyrmex costatus TaxID=456900 RepID=UPI00085222D8|nr:PREDICTED: E3 ubiquitin-protein ligase listerin [Cyphomyrmex costatus]
MGKNKQRTKNNARPSNSSRSAELLGTAMPNFVGFSAVKDGGYVPVLPGLSLCSINEVEMNSIDSNFQVTLKKMSKKDATTRFKALQEFTTLCQDAELSTVEGMLPFWPRFYCALSIDIDHRVREATQLAHAALVKRVGKGIALYLKQLAGAWFTAQYDTYPPAASAAINSFNSTFPPWKIINAIIHCQCEILLYISNNVIMHTAQTLSTQKSLTKEEMEAIYERVLTANLYGYNGYFKKVPLDEIDKTLEIHDKILSSSRFWKLAKHDSLPIKTAFFNVLTSIMENAEKLLENEKKRTVTTIMNSLDESEPAILSVVWESMLTATTKIDDWHLVVNINKLVLPKLWHTLRSGGQCCASTVYPNLLPFVSQFPKFNVDLTDLYTNFFNNMRQGFSVKSVQMSRSETLAVTTSFIECLRYSILINTESVDLCIRLLKEQLMPVIETCMMDSTFMKQCCFVEITHLIRYWSKNRTNEKYKSYVSLMEQFWIELLLLFEKYMNMLKGITYTADEKDSHIEFLLNLKNIPDRTRKKLKVKFSDPSDSVTINTNEPKVKVVDVYADTVFNAELCRFVNILCTTYFNSINVSINDHQNMEYIGQLNKLMKHFASRELFIAFSKLFKFDENFFEFYDKSLKPLLMQKSKIAEQILELLFYFITYISDAEKDTVLKSLIELNDIAVVRNVIYFCFSEYSRNDRVIKKWYMQANIPKILVDITKEIASCSDEQYDFEKDQNLILLAFEIPEIINLLINNNGTNEIVSILCDSLNGRDDICSMQFIVFITKLMTLMWKHSQTISSAVQILETLFELCTREHDAVDTMYNYWKAGLVESSQILSTFEFNDFIKRCGIIIWSKIYNINANPVNNILVNLATDILEVIINNIDKFDCIEETILLFLTASDIKLWIEETTIIAIYGEMLTGRLYMSNVEKKIQILQQPTTINITNDIALNNMTNCLSWALFITDLLNNLYKRGFDSEDTVSEENFESNDLPGITETLIQIIYVVSIADIYSKHYKSTEYYYDVEKLRDSLKNNFVNLHKYFAKNIRDDVLSRIRTNQKSYGCMLPYIIYTYYNEFFSKDDVENIMKYFENYNSNTIAGEYDDETHIQILQILNWPQNISQILTKLTRDEIYSIIAIRTMLSDTLKHQPPSSNDSVIDHIIMLHFNELFAVLDYDISDISWDKLCLQLEVIRLFATIVQHIPQKLKQVYWDVILIFLTKWQQLYNKAKHHHSDIKMTMLIIAFSQLYYAVETLMNKHKLKPLPELPSTLLDEWKNVIVGNIYNGIVRTWTFYANLCNQNTDQNIKFIIPLNYLGKAICTFDSSVLFKNDDEQTETINFNEMLTLSLKLLQSSVRSIQLGAYYILKYMVSELVQHDKILVESDNFESSNLNIKKFEEVLLNIQTIVNTMLMEFKLYDTITCTIQPFTDSYTYTLGYLLTWAIVLDICEKSDSDLRYHYAEILKIKLFPCLLDNIFKLIPMEALQDNRTVKLLELFTTAPVFCFKESWTEERLGHIVCWLYTNCLRLLPVLVRQWLSTVDSRVNTTIDKITSHYVSPMLCEKELFYSRLQLANVENMQIKVHSTAREVVAAYQMEDTKLELSIVLPPNYPLGKIKIESGQQIDGTAKWKNSLMQLAKFLTHQNGSVWDGLLMWKRNLDKKFAGVEECYICFSIFHINTYQVPKFSCHTCRKKFHTRCLYKWFNTSQKSTCPICRNVF